MGQICSDCFESQQRRSTGFCIQFNFNLDYKWGEGTPLGTDKPLDEKPQNAEVINIWIN